MISTEGKTVQQVLDEIAAKLITQGRRCVNSANCCAYGDGQGNHCAIGWLLPPDDDVLMYSSAGLGNLLAHATPLGPNYAFIVANAELLRDVQALHDEVYRAERCSLARIINAERAMQSEYAANRALDDAARQQYRAKFLAERDRIVINIFKSKINSSINQTDNRSKTHGVVDSRH